MHYASPPLKNETMSDIGGRKHVCNELSANENVTNIQKLSESSLPYIELLSGKANHQGILTSKIYKINNNRKKLTAISDFMCVILHGLSGNR